MSDNAPTSLNCPTCGAPLEVDGTRVLVRCKFCGNVSLIPGVLPAQAAAPASALDEIRKLAKAGNIIDALKKYREIYGVDLKDAKEAVEALQAGRLVTPSEPPGMHTSEELTKALQEVQRLLADGNKIEAIKIYRQNYDVSLARAKYAIEQIAAGNTLWPEEGFQTLTALPQSPTISIETIDAIQKPSRATGWVGVITAISILLLIAGIVAMILYLPGGALNKHYIPGDPLALVPSEQGANPDVAAHFYDPDADTGFIGLVDGITGKLRWQASALPGDGYAEAVAYGPDLVYAASGVDLLAYHNSDGSLAWQAQMPDKLNYGESTLLVTAGRVITTNADQTIQAYDASTGNRAWNMRLGGYDRTLRLMGGSLVVVDYTNDNNDFGLLFLDPATGNQQKVITPICTHEGYDSNIDPGVGFAYDQAEKAIFLVYDSSYGCVQRLDLTSGQIVWSTNNDDNFSFASDGFQSLVTDSTLYFSNDNDILAVNKSGGEMKVLLTNPDYELLPLAVAGEKLIVRARRTRGTERFELWGVDASSGNQVWQMDMLGASPIDPPDDMSGLIDDTDWGWTWKLTSTGLVIMKFQAKPNQLMLETFNLADGNSLGQQTIALKKVFGDFYSIPTVIGWQGSTVYLNVDSNIYALDVTTAKLKDIY
jgi:outer membrane protein assembly factor BamB/ribosomal protein L7/L12